MQGGALVLYAKYTSQTPLWSPEALFHFLHIRKHYVPTFTFHSLQITHTSSNHLISRNQLLAPLRPQHSTKNSWARASLSPDCHTLFQQKTRKHGSLPPCVRSRQQHATSFGTEAHFFSPCQKNNLHIAKDRYEYSNSLNKSK